MVFSLDSRTLLVMASTAAAVLLVEAVVRRFSRRPRKAPPKSANDPSWDSVELRPPFPPEIITLLGSSALCYLSTLADGAPHLSLMNFTYYPEHEKIIMSTRRDTTKFLALIENSTVAILVHDFPSEHRNRKSLSPKEPSKLKGCTYSVTLFGKVQVEEGADAELYRQAHSQRHGETQRQFIHGDNIAIISVLVRTAKICNHMDQVHNWDSKTAQAKAAALATAK
ncbi:hypothetical protein M885DRAFT_514416 [Pelagophyceae sp. CCMP2097]|nr:hypothetical protein M885DRAFT_514416 [Pelagophyceae sp. CCMP2097]|mmetsp:Transcript_150/g.569  ORF Transcript_150/g.569 Transcript_150/m.569 type:complete len:225 (+) Transcript_150:231-905(+)